MNRREMIRNAALLAAVPYFSGSSVTEIITDRSAVLSALPQKRFGDRRDWFFEKRFGMFVHWGLYAIPGWHEQHQWRARVPRAEFMKLAGQWNPVKFNPARWLDLMQAAGMKYITVTAKHHDGFCLWDTRETSFNTMNTPYGRDIIGMLADECRKRDVPLCIYYSIADWNHPAYPNQGRHHELPGPEPGDRPDWNVYLEFLKAQVRELCTNYGEISGFWWDMNVPQHKDTSINEMIRKLQPSAVINNRGFDEGDFGTPERDFDSAAAEAGTLERLTEACQSVGMESWGYKSDEDYYSDFHLQGSIDRYLARGANYLLNVGPAADGKIPAESASILRRLGKWYLTVAESFEDADPAPGLLAARDTFVTRKGNVIYIHFHRGSSGNGYKLKPLDVLPLKAEILNNGKPVETVVNLCPSDHLEQKPYLRIRNLPVNRMQGTVMVAKLEFAGDVFKRKS
ncbi:MAG: alpha-L-fucosidase [Bacteroidales bacterium]|jgi:alpha-L-fucosidase|nr:alpha-L-fucosidase [Bacteroidales bacterium]